MLATKRGWPKAARDFEAALKRYDSRLLLLRGLDPEDRQAIADDIPVERKHYWMVYRKLHGGKAIEHIWSIADTAGNPRLPVVDRDMRVIHREHIKAWMRGRKLTRQLIRQYQHEKRGLLTEAEIAAGERMAFEESARANHDLWKYATRCL